MTQMQQDMAGSRRRGTTASAPATERPLLAVISKVMAPYHRHQQLRIAREVPEVRLASVYLQQGGLQRWALGAPDEINAIWMDGPDEARYRRIPLWRKIATWRQGGRAIRWIRENQPAAVITPGYHDIGRLRILRWCWRNKVPVYVFTDANAASDHKRGLRRLMKKLYVSWIVRNVSGFMVCGRGGVEYFRQYGGDAKPHFNLPHEADYDAIQSLPEEQVQSARGRFGLRSDRRYVVFCGRMARMKRVDLLIDAFTQIADQRPDWDLLLIGGGPLLTEHQQRVHDSLRERVIWTGFINEPKTIHALYRASDVFVLPSEREPWGAVVAEACGAGLAIISSDVVGAALEMVRDGENGRLFRSRDCGSLVEALLDVTHPDHVDRMREATRAVLADWRRRGDPVTGVRQMLEHAGVLQPSERSPTMVET